MWASRSESFRRGTAESQVSDVIQETGGGEIALRGFVDTSPAGVGTDLHVTNLPNSGPWRVIVNGLLTASRINIREGNITGTIRGYLSNSSTSTIVSTGTAIISGNEFYIECVSGAQRLNVSWEYFPDTDNSSTRTTI